MGAPCFKFSFFWQIDGIYNWQTAKLSLGSIYIYKSIEATRMMIESGGVVDIHQFDSIRNYELLIE